MGEKERPRHYNIQDTFHPPWNLYIYFKNQ